MTDCKSGGKEPIAPNSQLKPNTIWHTAALPRDEQPLEYQSDFRDSFQSKKRRVSSGIEIVKCHICGHHFDSPAQLCDHLLDHDQDYRFAPIYKCSYGQCVFRTDDRPLMKYHISKVHLKTDQALVSKKHRNRKLLRPVILCGTCPMVFATETELWQHTPTCKDYRCQFCGHHFWTVEKRYVHEEIYHEDEFEDEPQEFEQDLQDPTSKRALRTHYITSAENAPHGSETIITKTESSPEKTIVGGEIGSPAAESSWPDEGILEFGDVIKESSEVVTSSTAE